MADLFRKIDRIEHSGTGTETTILDAVHGRRRHTHWYPAIHSICPSRGIRAAKQELIKEYGDPYVLSRAYLKRVDSWKPVPPNDVALLKHFVFFLKMQRFNVIVASPSPTKYRQLPSKDCR